MIKKLFGTAAMALAVAEGCSYNQSSPIRNNYNNPSIKQDKSQQEKEQAEEKKALKIRIDAITLRRDVIFKLSDKQYSTHFTEDELKEFDSKYNKLVNSALETKTIFKDDEELLITGDTIKRGYTGYKDKERYEKYIDNLSTKRVLLKNSIEEAKKLLHDQKTVEDKVKDEPKEPVKNKDFNLEELENEYLKGTDLYVSWLAFKDTVNEYSQDSKLSKDEKKLMIQAAIDEITRHSCELSKKEINRRKRELKGNEFSELEKKLKERDEVLKKLISSFSKKSLEE